MQTVSIRAITLFNGTRVCSVIDPATGTKRTHGLGAVGDPILPYLDHRHEGYVLTIALGADAPAIYDVQTSAPPLSSGRFPSIRRPWSYLGASDFSPFDGVPVEAALAIEEGAA